MTKEERQSWVTFEGLRQMIKRAGITYAKVGELTGLSESSINGCITGHQCVGTEGLASIAAFFRCGVNELIEFHGYEVKDEFSTSYFVPYEPNEEEPGVSYEPLRMIFKNRYGDDWREHLRLMYDTVDVSFHLTESQIQVHAERLRKQNKEKFPSPPENKHKDYAPSGVSSKFRSRLNRDGNVNLKNIYNICKVLGCTPDYVMSYR